MYMEVTGLEVVHCVSFLCIFCTGEEVLTIVLFAQFKCLQWCRL